MPTAQWAVRPKKTKQATKTPSEFFGGRVTTAVFRSKSNKAPPPVALYPAAATPVTRCTCAEKDTGRRARITPPTPS